LCGQRSAKQLTQILPPYRTDLFQAIDPRFKQLEVSFDVVVSKPGESRHNFLSYHFVIHRILELLGYDDLLARCKLLKSKTRLAELKRL